MQNVQEIAAEIVTREGGFVDDPDDPGGATKHGVTIATMRRLGLDLDGDGQVTKADVRALTRDQAVAIFVAEYFDRPGIATLPDCLQATVFDMYVNAGAQAVRLLQTLLRDMGYDVAVDGALGPQTATAARNAARISAESLKDAYGIARRTYYYRLADARAPLRKYARRRDGGKGGWITRAEAFISPQYHLSDVEHAKRVASWG